MGARIRARWMGGLVGLVGSRARPQAGPTTGKSGHGESGMGGLVGSTARPQSRPAMVRFYAGSDCFANPRFKNVMAESRLHGGGEREWIRFPALDCGEQLRQKFRLGGGDAEF